MSIERSQQLGRLLMALSGGALALFLAGVMRRSYLVLAIPVAIIAGATAGLTFWIGYTMATTRWEPDDLDEFADAAASQPTAEHASGQRAAPERPAATPATPTAESSSSGYGLTP